MSIKNLQKPTPSKEHLAAMKELKETCKKAGVDFSLISNKQNSGLIDKLNEKRLNSMIESHLDSEDVQALSKFIDLMTKNNYPKENIMNKEKTGLIDLILKRMESRCGYIDLRHLNEILYEFLIDNKVSPVLIANKEGAGIADKVWEHDDKHSSLFIGTLGLVFDSALQTGMSVDKIINGKDGLIDKMIELNSGDHFIF